MPNSIRVPRNRPRRRSVNFRSFFWLLTREAGWRIVTGSEFHDGHAWSPTLWCRRSTGEVRKLARAVVSHYPERERYP